MVDFINQVVKGSNMKEYVREFRVTHPVLSTLAETAIVDTAMYAMWRFIPRPEKVKIGNGGAAKIAEHAERYPILIPVASMTIFPLIEEAIFRSVPSFALNKMGCKGAQPLAGLATSAVFAAGHGRGAIPLPQFIGGVHFWHLLRTRGFGHAVLSHMAVNTWSYGLPRLGEGLRGRRVKV